MDSICLLYSLGIGPLFIQALWAISSLSIDSAFVCLWWREVLCVGMHKVLSQKPTGGYCVDYGVGELVVNK